MALEIDGKNVFELLGTNGVKSAVIMYFRERFIERTPGLIEDLSEKNESIYEYWLLGTGFGCRLEGKS